MLEHALETGAFAAVGGIRFVAAVALIVVDAAAYDLFGSELEFSVGFSALVAGGEQAGGEQADGEQGEC
jgi:hypothetical protein